MEEMKKEKDRGESKRNNTSVTIGMGRDGEKG